MSGVAPDEGMILVVDDDAGVRKLVTLVLTRSGFDVVRAASGREAVDVVRERGSEIDAVLLDVTMPVMDGHEAFTAMRAEQPQIPVVFFSGFDRGEVAEHLGESSAYTSFIPKPFENRDLLEEIRRAARGRL